ncbi:hypothetical protein [Shewanella sp. MF08487]|uniref:hypothetical protein n=1 Tax=Shewanella sp. MF08487 TaxID=3434873 RepID=UPI003D7A1860
MQYSYNQVSKIKEDLELLIDNLKNNPKYSQILSQDDIAQFEAHVPQYDVALNTIGIGGICRDSEINGGFKVTEEFIMKINSNIK